jgi:hypothetical protein
MVKTADFESVGDQVRIVRLNDKAAKLAELPPANTRRWVTRRKAQVVAAVRSGLLTMQEACDRYTLSEEEFNSWKEHLDQYGMRGLRATRIQDYRGAVSEGDRAGA